MNSRIAVLIMIMFVVVGCTGPSTSSPVKQNVGSLEQVSLTIPAEVYQSKVPLVISEQEGAEPRYLGSGQRPVVSPDNQKLAYVLHDRLMVSWLDGSRADKVLEAVYFDPLDAAIGEYVWSADSQRLAYVVDTARRVAKPKVFTYDLRKQESHLIFENGKAKYQSIFNLMWLDDGQLSFWANDLSTTHTYLADFSRDQVQRIATQGEMYSLSPGGPQAAYIKEQNGNVGVYLHERDKNSSKLVCTLPGDGYVIHMTWSPAGDCLVLWGNGVLYVVEPKTGKMQNIQFSTEGKYPEEVFWGISGESSESLLVSTMDGIYQCNIASKRVNKVIEGANFANFLAEGGIVYQTKGEDGTNQLWASVDQRGMMLVNFPGIRRKPMVGAGVKSVEIPNNGPEDGRIQVDLTKTTTINPETPSWQTINTSLEKYFLNGTWQGYGQLDQLYQLDNGTYYGVLLMYYLENDAYYPEAYEVVVNSTAQGPQVKNYEFLPFSPEFEP